MADLGDEADTLRDEHLARALARIDPAIAAGVAGECDECGEQMPRLIGGRCGFCRDGRPHPFETARAARPERAPAPASSPVKEDPMPNPPGSKTVAFVARGGVLEAIEARVAAGMSVSSATLSLVEDGLRAPGQDAAAEAERLLLDLAAVSLTDLLDEVRHRVERAGEAVDLLARATAAEAKLAAIAATIAPGAGA